MKDKFNIPTAPEAEMRLLGGSMKQFDWVNITISKTKESDYYDPKNRHIYSIIKDLYEKDSEVNFDKIEGRMDVKKCTVDHLVSIACIASTAFDPLDFVNEIKEASKKRDFQQIGKSLIQDCGNPEKTFKDILESTEAQVFACSESEEKTILRTFLEVMNSPKPFLEDLQERQNLFRQGISSFKGIPTGYNELDKHVKGLSPGHLIIVGARPGVGKTTFALNLVEKLVMEFSCNVLIFSLEMPAEELVSKMIAQRAEVSSQNIAEGNVTSEEYQRIVVASNEIGHKNIIIDDQASLSIDQVKSRCIRAKRVHDIGAIFIDYIQLLKSNKKGLDVRHLEIGDISRTLKEIAKELKVPVIGLAQLNRDVEKRTDKKPFLSDLRESGSLEADADVVLLLHRPDMYDPYEKKGLIEIIVSKNRFGPTGNFFLNFIKNTGRITNYEFVNIQREILNSSVSDEKSYFAGL